MCRHEVSVPFRGLSVLRVGGPTMGGATGYTGFRPLPGIERSPSWSTGMGGTLPCLSFRPLPGIERSPS